MPLFGKKKKDDGKKQDEAAAPKPAPYRHVPKHAASDARNHGLAETDKTAQQQRIMEASRSRLNSMNSNHSVKTNFTNVPINGSNSKPYFFAASNSSRQSFGNASRRDAAALQLGSPAPSVQPSLRAQEEYLKLRNPSFLSKTTSFGANPASGTSVKKQTLPVGADSSDSGYGSVGQVSRPESKAPSTVSKAPSELRKSTDLKAAPQTSTASTGVEFLPKLEFTPDSSRPSTPTEQTASVAQTAKPISIVTSPLSRNRAGSNTSSYVSRLDPGGDRRSIASSHSRPFDHIDFSKPGQQLPSPTTSTRPISAYSGFSDEPTPALQRVAQSSPPAQQPTAEPYTRNPPVAKTTPVSVPKAEPTREVESVPEPQREEFYVEPKSPRSILKMDPLDQQGASIKRAVPVERNSPEETPPQADGAASEPHADVNGAPGKIPQPQSTMVESTDAEPVARTESLDDERGRRVPQVPSIPDIPVQEETRKKSTSQTRSIEHSKPTGRYRNWSRPSQASGSQPDDERKNSSSSMNGTPVKGLAQMSSESTWQNGNASIQESEQEYRDFHRAQASQQLQRMTQTEPTLYPQETKWNDQGSSIYGDSTHSTRQHSPSRRQSFAPSEMLDHGPPTVRSALPPLAILDGLKVNKRGKILDEEGDPIGELVEGDIIDCVRQKANANGEVLDDYGRVVGLVTTLTRGGADVRSQSPATTVRSRGFSDYRSDMMQRYALPDSQIVSPTNQTLGRPFERTQEEEARQRAADLQAAAARRNKRGPEAHIELDGSGYAEAAPVIDHSEIFAPPFIPSRSPKRSPAEPAHHGMDSYFTSPAKKSPPPEEPPRLRKWASRNLEEDREEMQRSAQTQEKRTSVAARPVDASQPPASPQAGVEPTLSPLQKTEPVTKESAVKERDMPKQQQVQPDAPAQDLLGSDQPKDIFPWMTNPAPKDTGKWSSNIFTYKGEIPSEDANTRPKSTTAPSPGPQAAPSQSTFTTSAPLMKHYMPHLAGAGAGAGAGQRRSNRTSFREHVPQVKSPLSMHNITPPESDSGIEDRRTSTPRPTSSNTNASTSTAKQKTKTYFTHSGRQSMVVPDTKPTHTASTKGSAMAKENDPASPTDGAFPPPDVVRKQVDAKKKSRWSMSNFGKKTPPVQNLLKK